MSQKIVLASANSLKKKVIETAVKLVFPNIDYSVVTADFEKDGPEPIGEAELLREMSVSIDKLKQEHPDAIYYVAMEGGVVETDDGMDEISGVLIKDSAGRASFSRSVSFPIPPKVADHVRRGAPFATAVEISRSVKGVKEGGGFVGLLTDNHVDKKALYLQPAIVAFSKFLKSDWFF